MGVVPTMSVGMVDNELYWAARLDQVNMPARHRKFEFHQGKFG
jgi:hypothetical protein